ncbi:MAG TPA: CoA-transferase [Acidobacteriota bacterium]|nr:CoA-transferase [Acidobacteriota bacterium]
MSSKLMSMNEAIGQFVNDGDTIVIEGFTHLISFAAGHEIIRQKKRKLTACRLTPDLVYDQLIGAGCVSKLVFSWAGNPGAGPLYALRRAVEEEIPHSIDLDEYSHFGMIGRFTAGASKLPFFPLRNYMGSDLPQVNHNIRKVQCPYTGESLATVPALNPDVTILHAQRADHEGNTQIWGLLGVQKEAAFAANNVIVVVEEIVDEKVIRNDPNRTLIPGFIVSAVVHEPWGCHPSFAQGYYDRDNEFYLNWRNISKDVSKFNSYVEEWIFGVKDRSEYLQKMGDMVEKLKAKPLYCEPVNYGY